MGFKSSFNSLSKAKRLLHTSTQSKHLYDAVLIWKNEQRIGNGYFSYLVIYIHLGCPIFPIVRKRPVINKPVFLYRSKTIIIADQLNGYIKFLPP